MPSAFYRFIIYVQINPYYTSAICITTVVSYIRFGCTMNLLCCCKHYSFSSQNGSSKASLTGRGSKRLPQVISTIAELTDPSGIWDRWNLAYISLLKHSLKSKKKNTPEKGNLVVKCTLLFLSEEHAAKFRSVMMQRIHQCYWYGGWHGVVQALGIVKEPPIVHSVHIRQGIPLHFHQHEKQLYFII